MRRPSGECPAPGEIWAATGSDVAARSAWCAQLAREREDAALLNFAQHAAAAGRIGWPQARYYGEEGQTVGGFLSYETVYDVNPFEVGVRRPETRRAYRRRMEAVIRLLELSRLVRRPLMALSNGEMRRVLLARALAADPRLLILDDPAGGLDARQRERLRGIVKALAGRGLAVVFVCRHVDEAPNDVSRWLRIGRDGRAKTIPAPCRRKPPAARPCAEVTNGADEPVVEIRDLTLAVGRRRLFDGLSWTVRKGERWVLAGPNGSGKTTLFALVTGDSPLAYAADVRVFGIPREPGVELGKIRRRIGMVSPERQAYLGLDPESQLDEALRKGHDLLLLDEPFMNLEVSSARRAARRIETYLRHHPDVTAILICHRDDEIPDIFRRRLLLPG